MISLDEVSAGLKEDTDSDVIHLQTLRKAIGVIAFSLPLVLVAGENLRDWLLTNDPAIGRVYIEGSISAYFHTGMREIFVGSLCAIAVFLVCYKGYERRDNIAANVAGISVFLVALFPTPEQSREAGDTEAPVIDSATIFSGPNAPDPAYVGVVHFVAAAIFFTTLAVMSLFLFTLSDKPNPTPKKIQRNRIYVFCGLVMLACLAVIGIGKLFLGDWWDQRPNLTFWLETVMVVFFGISWLTKAEVIFGDDRVAAGS
ncbi:MAG: hypothetical protein WD802_11620 [Gemmatimonadaceae bacterium]